MKRREVLLHGAVIAAARGQAMRDVPLLPAGDRLGAAGQPAPGGATLVRRNRPGNPGWPTPENWAELDRRVGGRLIRLRSPFAGCETNSAYPTCRSMSQLARNPYFIGEAPALTQTSGWADAWISAPGAWAVAAESAADVAAAVTFAGQQRLRLVVRGGGHSYQGTSNAPDRGRQIRGSGRKQSIH